MTASPDETLAAIVPLISDTALRPVAGESPLVGVLDNLLGAAACVVVAAAEPLVDNVRRLVGSAGMDSVRVATVADPVTRTRCLAAGLEFVGNNCGSTRFVLVYDVSQPLASPELCDRVVTRLLDGDPVVLPALPVTDSVKAVDETGSVVATVDRATLRMVQYPRGFAVDQLAALLARPADAGFDEVSQAIAAGAPITLVEGDAEVFIADLPRDARFVEAVIESRRRH